MFQKTTGRRLSLTLLSEEGPIRLNHVLAGWRADNVRFTQRQDGVLVARSRLIGEYWAQLGLAFVLCVSGSLLLLDLWLTAYQPPNLLTTEGVFAIGGALSLLWYGHYCFKGAALVLSPPNAKVTTLADLTDPPTNSPYTLRKHVIGGIARAEYKLILYTDDAWFVLSTGRSETEFSEVISRLPVELGADTAPWGPTLIPKLIRWI